MVKACAIKDIPGIQVIVNANAINYAMLVNIRIIQIVSAEKKLPGKLIDECTETIEETKLVNITFTENENNYEHNSCKVYIALMIVAFTIFTGITVYLVYYNWSLINNNIYCIKFDNRKKKINKNLMRTII